MAVRKYLLSLQLSLILLHKLNRHPLRTTLKCLPPTEAEEEVVSIVGVEVTTAETVAAEAAEVVNKIKIKINKTLIILITPPHQPTKNLIKEVPDTLTGPQIHPVAAIGPKVEERLTVRTRWSVGGPASLPQGKRIIIIEKLACLD